MLALKMSKNGDRPVFSSEVLGLHYSKCLQQQSAAAAVAACCSSGRLSAWPDCCSALLLDVILVVV